MRGATGDRDHAASKHVHIALLRGINVGGHNLVAMSNLRELFTSLGFSGVRSLLQSGNVVFESHEVSNLQLEQLFEKETAKRLGVSIDYVVRGADEWAGIVARNPFPDEAKSDPGHLVVTCLKAAPAAKDVDALRQAIQGREIVRADAKQLYVVYPDGIGKSKLTNVLIERLLRNRGTARNWNTVLKLATLCAAVGPGL
jgi:uncharacterized protein (DUF1697 family)